METADALRALCHRQTDAPPGNQLCTLAIGIDARLSYAMWIREKQSFSINKTSDPADLDQSFLLIVRSLTDLSLPYDSE